jgi:hypothetical protein
VNETQRRYIVQHYTRQSVKEMAAALSLDRKEVQRELRRILASPASPREAPGGFPPALLHRMHVAAAVAVVLLPALFLFWKCAYAPDISFVAHDRHAQWIMFPSEITTYAESAVPGRIPVARFVKSFERGDVPGPVVLHVKAMRELSLFVNGTRVPLPEVKNWKRERTAEVSGLLQAGANTIKAEAENRRGPQLLYLYAEGLGSRLATDPAWKVQINDGPLTEAIVADDTRVNPDSKTVPSTWAVVKEKARLIFILFLAAAVLYLAGHFLLRRFAPYLPWIALAAVHAAWFFIFLAPMMKIDPNVGYDARGHVEYILFLLERGRLPLATDGWALYHPPLFYLASAVAVKTFGGAYIPDALKMAKYIPFLSGLGQVWLAFALSRLIFRKDALKVFFSVLAAGLMPMNIYMSGYISNESAHGFLAGACLVAGARVLAEKSSPMRDMSRIGDMALAGIFAGLALLTKFTVLVLLPLFFFFAAFKLLAIERAGAKKTVARLGLSAAWIAVIAGWFYLRNAAHFGHPIVGNWNLPGEQNVVLQLPGFHTLRYYLNFSEGFVSPFFSGFHSFWDALYSTFWGDGYVGGRAMIAFRHPYWNYDGMTAVYLVALPASVILLAGAVRALVDALRGEDWELRCALSFLLTAVLATGAAMVSYTLTVPAYSTGKAFFGLHLLAPLAVFAAMGFDGVSRLLGRPRLLPLRAVYYGWLGVLAGLIVLSYSGWQP